jgi:predicted RNA binding protein YcfA (HicA-like mRNA interferase family)
MPEVPLLSGRETVRVFEKFGWKKARQKGSHIVLVKEGLYVTLSVPDHKEVARGTLRSLIRLAGLTVAEFVDALKE